ncbi:MAG: PD-(D/E)XK nuclease family protein [Candidatus Thiodiazotropha sp. (ex Lucinoma aequizonata)]|nr:PD-(D/E)XK nuclease family protein [Candidatus Thiodiazotropha sp. (ex Lucinoma aequizonata)]
MKNRVLQFLLVPDSSVARRARRALVANGACSGIVVGTWPELVEYARNAYVIPTRNGNWDEIFNSALGDMSDAFWAESFSVSPQETAAAVEMALCQIVSASDPAKVLIIPNPEQLSERPCKHIGDIVRLIGAMEGVLPNNLSVIRDLISANSADAIQQIYVYYADGVPALTRWQSSLIEKLNNDAGISINEQLDTVLHEILSLIERPDTSSSLAVLQTGLFLPPGTKGKLDNSIQWVGTRDFLEEAEMAASLVQTMLGEHSDLRLADMGLLLPDSFEYSVAVDDAFTRAGLAVSGLPVERWQRDLGREALFHFLYCREKPAPAMALAVCLSSPLMPWSREEGAVLAQNVMDGDYRFLPFHSAGKNAKAMLDLIRDGDEEPKTLIQALQSFSSLLDGVDEFIGHVYQCKSTVDSLCTLLANMSDIDWVGLRRASSPKTITTGESPDFNLEGITVWRGSHEPWRPVHHLIVFGFAAGNYPSVSGTSLVFVANDLNAIREHMELKVDTHADELMRQRARFKRQLSAASDFVTFLVPRRDPSGAKQAPSESLVFMQQLFEAPEDLILELDSAEARSHVRYLAQVEASKPHHPRALTANDIQFDQDLLSLRTDSEGNLKPESPSSLETLMVSRLAWLLRRLRAKPLRWAPEEANVMLLGTLAHQVFEELFQRGQPPPEREEITERVSVLLDDAIQQYSPFLRAAQWQVERCHLAAGITKAALAWREVVQTLGAEILGSEEWLEGKLDGIPIHGQADVLLSLSDNRLLVVDYKRSSANSRRPRMQKGYDSQASLYRTMLQTGGPKDKESTDLINNLTKVAQTGIVYFMLNDQTALSDSVLIESREIPGWEVMDGDVASHAIELIERRLREVRAGLLCLNREGDSVFFDKQAGVKPYALENSPLIPLFTMSGEADEAG